MSSNRLLLTALALALAGCSGDAPGPKPASQADSAKRMLGRVAFEPCALSSALAAETLNGMCGTVAVPEDPATPNGRKIDLRIAWLKAGQRADANADPVFFLAGGPGQAASEHAAAVSTALREVLKNRNVFLVDQRGTGKSAPLNCPKGLEDEYKDRSDTPAIGEYAAKCAAAQKNDARLFTTTVAVQDLDAVRQAIGAQKVNLVGVSYGTRVAQQYAARYPAQTRALVLDGVAPNDIVVGGEFARTFERTLLLRGKACAADPVCKKRYPQDLRAQLMLLKQRLAANPVEVDYRDPATGEAKREKLSAQSVVSLTQMFSYMPQAAALLPVVIDEAVQGRYGPLMALSSMGSSGVTGGMNRGMQWSVICAEDADRYVRDPADANTALGHDLVDMFFAACKSWPRGTRPTNFTAPLKTNVPALLMSGELDPVTPPEYAARVAKTLPNGRALVLRGQGHGVMGTGCMPKLVGQFIESANAKALDTKCLASVAPVPPFTSFNGWEP